ncbi:MAG: type I DNA topoisomerase [Chloroflexota bacterium]
MPGRKTMKKLVIVESPAKARTLTQILGKSYLIKASMGHVRDLPQKDLGVDIEHDFLPKYVVPTEKRKVVKEIREAANGASAIYLATDPDREGEAISWHLVEAAKLEKDRIPLRRVAFHELTPDAVKEAFDSPREISVDLVNAQQARRVLDRLVGYKLSPLLWRKIQRGLSAGRVQSVALVMVVEREKEIEAFTTREYWTIEAELKPEGKEKSFRALLTGSSEKKELSLPNQGDTDRTVARLEKASYSVTDIQEKTVARQPSPPFITSTLQQEASRRLRFTAARTMFIAQQLYEGLPMGEEGTVGLITYMRTDSTHVAASAIAEAREFIGKTYGPEFVPDKPRVFAKKGKFIQEAHEAIRPTRIFRQPAQVTPHLTAEQLKLYDLVWKRMVASQMAATISDVTSVSVEAATPEMTYFLKATGSREKFAGFTRLYVEEKDEEKEEKSFPLPRLEVGQDLGLAGLFPEQHFTQPPPRYTEATLIKALEQKGIGRPSTYAPIVSLIQEREYVHKAEGRFHPDKLGVLVSDLLKTHFPSIVDYGFTARMEAELDDIAHGQKEWQAVLRHFYTPFAASLEKASQQAEKVNIVSDQVCSDCGRPMLVKAGRFGRFLACSRYPDCRCTLPLRAKTVNQASSQVEKVKPESDQVCPDCGKRMVVKEGRFGTFLACSGYPECRRTMPLVVKTGAHCPECGKELVQIRSKKGRTFYGCPGYPECRFTTWSKPLPQPCPNCGKLLVQAGKGTVTCLKCDYKGEAKPE